MNAAEKKAVYVCIDCAKKIQGLDDFKKHKEECEAAKNLQSRDNGRVHGTKTISR